MKLCSRETMIIFLQFVATRTCSRFGQEDKMEEPILLIQDTPNRFGSSNPQERVENKVLNQANAGYEIPARLRTLHNLVIQYASQGR